MWPFSEMSLSTASLIGTIANWGLLASLVAGLLSTFVIVKTTDRKEEHWADDRRQSNEFIANLNNNTARLTAENLTLQTVLLPRHVGLLGIDEQPKAKEWFKGFEQLAGTKLLIQFAPDAEAQNLANEIAIVLSRFGWRPEFIDERRSHVSLSLAEGITVMYAASMKAWDPANPPEQQQFARLHTAGHALAAALTKAGLGIGAYPVQPVGLPAYEEKNPTIPWFDPVLDGVYLQVGARPVSLTMEWIRQGRPDILGNKAVDAVRPASPDK